MCNGLARVMHTQDVEAATSNELLRKAASALFISGFARGRRLRNRKRVHCFGAQLRNDLDLRKDFPGLLPVIQELLTKPPYNNGSLVSLFLPDGSSNLWRLQHYPSDYSTHRMCTAWLAW